MRDKGKPFVVYRRGDFFTFVPQGIKGWAQLAVWLVLVSPLVLWLLDHLETAPSNADYYLGIVLFLAIGAMWLIGGVWWLFAHAQMVDMPVLLRDRQMAERKKRRRGE